MILPAWNPLGFADGAKQREDFFRRGDVGLSVVVSDSLGLKSGHGLLLQNKAPRLSTGLIFVQSKSRIAYATRPLPAYYRTPARSTGRRRHLRNRRSRSAANAKVKQMRRNIQPELLFYLTAGVVKKSDMGTPSAAQPRSDVGSLSPCAIVRKTSPSS